jgi:hypothetical protein
MIVAGKDVNLLPSQQIPSDITNARWSDDQKISSKFIRDVLTNPDFYSQISSSGLIIVGAWFPDGLDLSHAQRSISTKLTLDSCKFDGPCEFSYSTTSEEVILTNCFGRNVKAIHFTGADFRISSGKWMGQVLFFNSKSSKLDFNGVRSEKLWLSGCEITGFLHINGNANYIIVERTIVHDEISLSDLNAKFTFDEVSIERGLSLTDCSVAADSSWKNIHINGDLTLSKKISPAIVLSYIKVDRDLDLTSLQGAGTIDLTGATVGRSLELYRDPQNPDLTVPAWQENSRLILAEAKVGYLFDEKNWWPKQIDVSGFSYARWRPHDDGELRSRWSNDREWFFTWLERQAYSAESYIRLANTFVDVGMTDASKEVLFRSKQREREVSGIFSQVVSSLSWLLTGYGYHYEFSVFWCLGFVVVGALVLRFSEEGRRFVRDLRFGTGDLFFYSLDAFLPFVHMRKDFADLDLQSKVKYYFYIHRLAGYVIGSFIIAGLAGLYK